MQAILVELRRHEAQSHEMLVVEGKDSVSVIIDVNDARSINIAQAQLRMIA